jgi:hypothetical protein
MNLHLLTSRARPGHLILLGASSALLLSSGCVVYSRPGPPPPPVVYAQPGYAEPGEVVVTEDAPPPVAEVVGIAPGPGFLWVGGYYHWNYGRWVWMRGHYERPPHPGAVWVRPRYAYRGGARIYVRGYWR